MAISRAEIRVIMTTRWASHLTHTTTLKCKLQCPWSRLIILPTLLLWVDLTPTSIWLPSQCPSTKTTRTTVKFLPTWCNSRCLFTVILSLSMVRCLNPNPTSWVPISKDSKDPRRAMMVKNLKIKRMMLRKAINPGVRTRQAPRTRGTWLRTVLKSRQLRPSEYDHGLSRLISDPCVTGIYDIEKLERIY